jgi:putative transposase
VSIEEPTPVDVNAFIGVGRNTTGHIAVAANPDTGKVYKPGKEALPIHKKYKGMRRSLQTN